jgi:peroxiredoxin
MKRLLCLTVVWACTAFLFGQEFKLGSKVDDFTLTDVKGNPVQLSSLQGDLTVITFIATQCPVSNAYNDRMKAIYNDYASKGVKFVFINPNNTEPASEVESHARQNGFPFAVYKDERNQVADRFGAEVTPEVFVLDKSGVIRYHGSIDDSQNLARVQDQRLRKVLDAMQAGKAVETARTKAFGCTIKRAKKVS